MSKSIGKNLIVGVNNMGLSQKNDNSYQQSLTHAMQEYIRQYNNYPQSQITDNMLLENPNYISDEDLYQKMWGNIKQHESVVPYPYLDTKGNITIGGGANIDNINDFMKVNFTVNGEPATMEQKLVAYNTLRNLSEEQDVYGNYVNHNRDASSFENNTNLRITDQDAYNMAYNHLAKDLSHIRTEFTDFDKFPLPLKEVLLDIQYNTGGLNEQNWPRLYQAIRDHNVNGVDGIVTHVHRQDVSENRNNWAQDKARLIVF